MPDDNCPFCDSSPSISRNDLAYARYDIYPVNEGHILVVPFRHVSDFFELTNEERDAVFQLIDEAKNLLDKKHNPDGYNIGINVGEAAGQTVWHAHVHLIPRYNGDVGNPRGGVRGVIPKKQKY